jgi:hypothetical protein
MNTDVNENNVLMQNGINKTITRGKTEGQEWLKGA